MGHYSQLGAEQLPRAEQAPAAGRRTSPNKSEFLECRSRNTRQRRKLKRRSIGDHFVGARIRPVALGAQPVNFGPYPAKQPFGGSRGNYPTAGYGGSRETDPFFPIQPRWADAPARDPSCPLAAVLLLRVNITYINPRMSSRKLSFPSADGCPLLRRDFFPLSPSPLQMVMRKLAHAQRRTVSGPFWSCSRKRTANAETN